MLYAQESPNELRQESQTFSRGRRRRQRARNSTEHVGDRTGKAAKLSTQACRTSCSPDRTGREGLRRVMYVVKNLVSHGRAEPKGGRR